MMSRRLRLVLLVLLVQCLTEPTRAGEVIDTDRATAAYLYHFFNFTQWPAGAITSEGSFLRLCLVGDDDNNLHLDAIDGKAAGAKTLQILRMTASASFEQCHTLFLIYRSSDVRDQVLSKTRHLATLTVSSTPGFVEAGGVVEFVRSEDRLTLKINAGVMHDKGLQISSKLLNLAEVVNQ